MTSWILLIDFWQHVNNIPWGKTVFSIHGASNWCYKQIYGILPLSPWWTRCTNNQTEVIEMQYLKLGGKPHCRRTGDCYTALGSRISWIWPQDKNRWIWMCCPTQLRKHQQSEQTTHWESISNVPILCSQSMRKSSHSSKESKITTEKWVKILDREFLTQTHMASRYMNRQQRLVRIERKGNHALWDYFGKQDRGSLSI